MNRFPEMRNIAHLYHTGICAGVGESAALTRPRQHKSLYKSLSILTDVAIGAMLAIEAAMHMPFTCVTGDRNLINLWKIFEKDEKIFTRMLTLAAIYGMIAVDDIV